ncbi:DUF2625 family protein [Nonomuraea sp. NEAU-A123]|uniref:DUF2625 family protein n=1 Tax=Nonomuraea sp. NEAU-A123 TaxID=2839649 RepID=UPI001BE3FB2B|nr:DUF2625 family protein [Nonomuraea sp. NEAU-A123]MBT2233931.1 DUF2625 family protein [Nonomuraea sp. NEAU-A123]
MRELSELNDGDDPAWPGLQEEFATTSVPLKVLPGDPEQGRSCLSQLQVSVESYLGALALHSGGLILDGGWLRVFGGSTMTGADALPSLAQVNCFPAAFDPGWRPADGLIVAQDILGGVFALNGHDAAKAGRPGTPGQVIYFAPDSLEWQALEMGYGTWLTWLLTGRLEQFYGGLRWPGWRAEVRVLSPAQGIAFYPFLWSDEAHANLAATTRRPVPVMELLRMNADFCQQLGVNSPGFLGSV